jgi:AMMECR1 domain-containing protein
MAGHEVLSYEGPFGVGYGVAVLFDAGYFLTQVKEDHVTEHFRRVWADVLPQVARETVVAALVKTMGWVTTGDAEGLTVRRAVFVTILDPSGKLRGCAGTLSPKHANIVEETRQAALAAAFSDRRFSRIIGAELPGLHFEVSVLERLEQIASVDELDPDHYGLVVSTPDGRQGCLLPGIPEIRTAQRQLDIARRKAAIAEGEPVRLQRFAAEKFKEPGATRVEAVQSGQMVEGNHPAGWWIMLADGRIECQVCPRLCKLHEGQRGFCFVRQRVDDRLLLTSYGRSSGFCVDPMEKKPLNHFYPGTSVLSFGTAGCNLGCRFCQNWDISKARESDLLADAASPEQIAETAQKLGCQAVAFSYNDPVIFLEYAIDVAQA